MRRLMRFLLLLLIMLNGRFANAQNDVPDANIHAPVVLFESLFYGTPSVLVNGNNGNSNYCLSNMGMVTYWDDTIKFNVGYEGVTGGNHSWKILIANITDGWNNNFYNPLDPDDNEFGDAFDVTVRFNKPGVYRINLSYLGIDGNYHDFDARLVLIKRVNKVWIEAPPICNVTPADDKYHFKIKTDRPLTDSVMFSVGSQVQMQSICTDIEAYMINQSCNIGGWVPVAREGIHPGTWIYSDKLPYYGTMWPEHYPDTGHSIQDYSAAYTSNLDLVLGDTVLDYIHLAFSDNVLDTFNISAPLIDIGNTYHLDNYTVTGSETWSYSQGPVADMNGGGGCVDIYIKGNLVIEAGAKLTLSNVNVHFGPKGKMIIKNGVQGSQYGGYVYMDHAKLTSVEACGTTGYWKGVEVWGLASNSQLGSIGQTYQGYLNMVASEIKFAEIGVLLGKTGDNYNIYTGGILRGWYSDFTDNKNAVKFMRYYYPSATASYIYANASTIQGCDFVRNSGGSSQASRFIWSLGVNNLEVKASTFTDAGNHGNTYGILAGNTGLRVIGNWFTSLRYGIYTSGVTNATWAGYIDGNRFNNNNNATIISNLAAPKVIYNTYEVPNPSSLQTTGQYIGLYLFNSNGYTVNGNTLKTTGSAVGTLNTGILVQSSGPFDNKLTENNITKLGVGILSNYMNTNASDDPTTGKGLQVLCNNITNCKRYIAARGYDSTQHGMRILQGLPASGGNGTVADNTLQYVSGTVVLYNGIGEVNRMNYHWKSGLFKYPISKYGTVLRPSLTASAQESCPSLLPPVIVSPPGGGSTPSFPFLFKLMQDTTGGTERDSLYTYVPQLADEYGDLLMVDKLLDEKKISAANDMYNNITKLYTMQREAADEYENWGRRLMNVRISMIDDGLEWEDLDSARVDSLELIAANANMWAKARAQGWLAMYDGRMFDNEMLYPDTTITAEPDSSEYSAETGMGEGRYAQQGENPTIEELQKAGNNFLYPNPVHDYLNIVYKGEAGTLLLTDIAGRVVLSQQIKEGENRLNVQKLPSGIYLYRVKEGNRDMLRGKIIKD